MQAVGEPDVDVQGQRAGANCPDGLLADRDRMLTEGPPEAFIEPNTFLPERPLAFICRGCKGYRVLHKGAVLPELCSGIAVRNVRRQAEIRRACSLTSL